VQNWTLTTDFYLVAVQDAMTHYGAPDIFNTDQGCWFTSQEFMGLLTQRHIAVSMGGQGSGGITYSSKGSDCTAPINL
jgi:putative transposase